jgi:hypothetical protein
VEADRLFRPPTEMADAHWHARRKQHDPCWLQMPSVRRRGFDAIHVRPPSVRFGTRRRSCSSSRRARRRPRSMAERGRRFWYGLGMKLVAIVRAPRQPEESAKALADASGLTPSCCRRRELEQQQPPRRRWPPPQAQPRGEARGEGNEEDL